ncbi:MAG: PAS domain-containing protein, partial [Solirubrobacteraceae bacterium]
MPRSSRSTGSASAEPACRTENAVGERRARNGRAGRELLETAFAQAPIGMALIDLDGRWMRANAAACAVTGWPEHELLVCRLRDITHPDDVDTDGGALDALVAGAIGGFRHERRLVTQAGEPVWVLLSVALIRDAEGGPRHFIVQMQDISLAKQAQRKLQEAEAEARAERDHATAIITAMGEGYVLTRDGEIKAVNEALCTLTGFPASALVGAHPPYPFWPPEQVDTILQVHTSVVRDHGGDNQLVLMRADGERFEAEVTTRPASEDGRTIGFVTTVRDVS